MKNIINCPNCETENNFFDQNCRKCSALIRERVVNIDLWNTIWNIIESPKKAFTKIIYAENKNYTFFLAILFSLKLTFNSFFIQSILGKDIDSQNYLGVNVLIGLFSFLILFSLITFSQKRILKNFNIITRFKDNFASFIYSSIPILISFFIIFPTQFALFGRYWLFSNPSPFEIKPLPAYVFSGMEILILIWSGILFFLLSFVQTKSKVYSIIFAIAVLISVGIISVFIPYL
ncbi:MAG: hypothetical protein ABFS12_03125 [Bacteroidota bacterium]